MSEFSLSLFSVPDLTFCEGSARVTITAVDDYTSNRKTYITIQVFRGIWFVHLFSLLQVYTFSHFMSFVACVRCPSLAYVNGFIYYDMTTFFIFFVPLITFLK